MSHLSEGGGGGGLCRRSSHKNYSHLRNLGRARNFSKKSRFALQQQICQNSFNSSFFIVHANSIVFLLKIRSFLSLQISESSHVFIGQENSLLFGQIKDSELKKG